MTSGGSISRRGNVTRSGGGSRSGGGHGGGYSGYRDGAKGGGHHGGGHRHSYSEFYFGPYGYGYGYYGNGFGISIGLPLYPYYYDYYTQPYYIRPYYTDYGVPYDGDNAVVDSTYPVPPTATNGPVIPASAKAADFQLQAEQAFREHRFEDAARLCNHATVEDSQNGKLHLFNAQTLFALGEYRSAAAAIQHGAALLDRSEWGFVVENYKEFYRGDDYVVQMGQLVRFINENPNESYAYLLRGYHYKFLGYDEAARKQLAKAVELESRDRLAAELLAMTGGELPSTAPMPPPTSTEEALTVPDSTTEQIPAEASDNP
jgi:tetratricopeptide (TPR) repeat protein